MSEPGNGSDIGAASTTAKLSNDGKGEFKQNESLNNKHK